MYLLLGAFIFLYGLSFSSASADGIPRLWQMGFQEPATETMELIVRSHNFVMIVMSVVCLVVFALLLYVMVRFRKKEGESVKFNTRGSHNALLEILWTIIPLVIVGFLTVSNVKLIRQEQKIPEAGLVLKAIGYQWYWSYVYPESDIRFDSYMKPVSELGDADLRLLEVDNRVVVPTNTVVLLQVASADVIHSWAVPSLGVKIDAVPGRLNEAWFSIRKPGVYYGQCSELCGRLHGFMPIVIEAVDREKFSEWIAAKKGGA